MHMFIYWQIFLTCEREQAQQIISTYFVYFSYHSCELDLLSHIIIKELKFEAQRNYFYFFHGCTCGRWKFPDLGSNVSHSCDLCHSCGNTKSLTHCTGPGSIPKLPQRQHQIPNPCAMAGTVGRGILISNSKQKKVYWRCLKKLSSSLYSKL